MKTDRILIALIAGSSLLYFLEASTTAAQHSTLGALGTSITHGYCDAINAAGAHAPTPEHMAQCRHIASAMASGCAHDNTCAAGLPHGSPGRAVVLTN